MKEKSIRVFVYWIMQILDSVYDIDDYFRNNKKILLFISMGLILFSMAFFIIPKKPAVVSGVFAIKGTVPQNSTITLFAKDIQSASDFSPVMTGLTITGLPVWQYKGNSGRSYEIKAGLVVDGKVIKYSNVITVKAPAFNNILSFTFPAVPVASSSGTLVTSGAAGITSNAVATNAQPSVSPTTQLPSLSPAPTKIIVSVSPSLTPTPTATISALNSGLATISGSIFFNGQAPLNTRIVIFERVTGTQNYQLAVDNLPPINGATWIWSNASNAVTYDILGVLKQKQTNGTDMDVAYSSALSATAPTTTSSLNITSPSSLSAPSPNISVSCITLNGTTQTWSANVSYQTIQGAQSYWFEIGTTDGGIDMLNQTQNATSGSNQIVSPPLKNGTTYYARYAYSAVANLSSGSNQFSSFSSPTVQIKCSQ